MEENTKHALLLGNSDGIGLALTQRLLSEGWSVIGISRKNSSIDSPTYRHLVIDVCSELYQTQLTEIVSQHNIELCVYCVGIGEIFQEASLADDIRVMQVNLVAAITTMSVVLPPMLSKKRGHVIVLSSIGDGISPDAPSYAASKAGLSSYTEGLSLALRKSGVMLTNVRFGFVDTKMAKSAVKPFMISADKAADILMRCVARRPARVTYPKKMAALVWILNWANSMRNWFR